jgi:hypothetical protein
VFRRLLLPALVLAPALGAGEPAVWRVDNPGRIGGHAPAEVLGTPRAADGALEFDGVKDGLILGENPLAGWKEFTIEVLFHPAADGPAEQRFLHVQDEAGSRALLETRLDERGWWLDTFLWQAGTTARGLALIDPARVHPAGRWHWVALRYDGAVMTSFVNGVKQLEGAYALAPMGPGRVSLGVRQNKVHWFKGRIREVRFHPRALPAEELQRIPTG